MGTPTPGSATPSAVGPAEQAAALFLIVGLTFILAAPPMLQGDRSVEVCGEIADDLVMEPAWSTLPIPHWTCTSDQAETVHLGWWL